MRVEQPVLPLSKAAFAAALRKGHGRAIQHIESHGANGFEGIIIEASVFCSSYDPQLEAPRAPWLFSIVDRVKLNAKVVQSIRAMESMPPPESCRDSDSRSAILKELAASGSEDARRLLYASLAIFPNTATVISADEIITLDGVDGLMYVARQMGQWLHADPDFWVDDSIITTFDGCTGSKGGLAALEREATVDCDIANYLAGMRKTHDGFIGSSPQPPGMAFTGMKSWLTSKANLRIDATGSGHGARKPATINARWYLPLCWRRRSLSRSSDCSDALQKRVFRDLKVDCFDGLIIPMRRFSGLL
ncbi:MULTISPECIES: hypothetical protein [Pseudomonas syringae group]|uniref:Uncharacterized protein n=2 Tax=Pseudomonas syringae group TaxID=136849 RepID=A0A3M2W9F6_PSEA0|nr:MULTISPECIES: hypothetical protein [Pseudomonas syringae group]EGH13379.1 hypothetical protein PSYMP_24251 [Pseudomonas amygdali pv. morsprunorum str. M302280]RML48160.1 hypothetical protein ALQ94_04126 [Pseudomonas amygdali pv. morsprunorum]SOS35236.1 hypothetical protein CFBP6411_03879 [Pseudomonas syringae group genomosp. 3]SPF19459.1 hypothetical protein PSCFBP3800_03995 [Pseudomonas syringae group genomosp. 3]